MTHPARLAALLLAALATSTAAADVKLITLPGRERVEIQLDHPHQTLVEEERVVPLARGVNDIVFAWANTNIDRDSIQLRCLDDDDVVVLSMTYPPGQAQLTWQVSSPDAGAVRVRISYIVGGLMKSFAYRAVASPDETTLTLWQYLQLHNQTAEAFGVSGMWAGFGERLERPIGVNETKRLLASRFDDVPVQKRYVADLSRHGYLDQPKNQLRVPMYYRLVNDEANGLGAFALMPGKARIFQDDGKGTQAFLGEDWAGFTPKQDELRLALGVAQDIVVIRTIERRRRDKVRGQLSNYDIVVKYEIENFKDSPVTLDLAESIVLLRSEVLGHRDRPVEWEIGPETTLGAPSDETTADRVLFRVNLPKRGDDQKAVKQVHKLHVVIKNEW